MGVTNPHRASALAYTETRTQSATIERVAAYIAVRFVQNGTPRALYFLFPSMRINTGYYEGINQTSLSLQRLKAERRSKKKCREASVMCFACSRTRSHRFVLEFLFCSSQKHTHRANGLYFYLVSFSPSFPPSFSHPEGFVFADFALILLRLEVAAAAGPFSPLFAYSVR